MSSGITDSDLFTSFKPPLGLSILLGLGLGQDWAINFNPIRPEGPEGKSREGRGRAESARTGINLQELPLYSSNTFQMLGILLNAIGGQNSGKNLRQVYNLLSWKARFRRLLDSNFDIFKEFFH